MIGTVLDANPFFCTFLFVFVTLYPMSELLRSRSRFLLHEVVRRTGGVVHDTNGHFALRVRRAVNPIHFRLVPFVRSCSPCLRLRSILSCFFLGLVHQQPTLLVEEQEPGLGQELLSSSGREEGLEVVGQRNVAVEHLNLLEGR
jgi:hypothetical protein